MQTPPDGPWQTQVRGGPGPCWGRLCSLCGQEGRCQNRPKQRFHAGDTLDDANFETTTANAAILRITRELAWIEEVLAPGAGAALPRPTHSY